MHLWFIWLNLNFWWSFCQKVWRQKPMNYVRHVSVLIGVKSHNVYNFEKFCVFCQKHLIHSRRLLISFPQPLLFKIAHFLSIVGQGNSQWENSFHMLCFLSLAETLLSHRCKKDTSVKVLCWAFCTKRYREEILWEHLKTFFLLNLSEGT